MHSANPFAVPGACWVLRFDTHKDVMPAIEEGFADLALATALTELDEKQGLWQVEIITASPPDEADCIARCALISELAGQVIPPPSIRVMEKKDWVSETAKSFPPLRVGPFFVHGSHYRDPIPAGSIPLWIDAGLAFGSGEHATTSGCLLALSNLAKSRRFARMLDMGCGSGILAIAMAKRWHKPALATDVDPVSVRVSRDNAKLNRTSQWMRTGVQDGFSGRLTPGNKKFDLIVANILARPLVKMARAMAQNLAPGGAVVLSGLLETQERYVLQAYRAQGLYLRQRFCKNGWSALVLA